MRRYEDRSQRVLYLGCWRSAQDGFTNVFAKAKRQLHLFIFLYIYLYIYISVQCYEIHNIRLLQLNVGIINMVYLRSQACSAT